MPLSRAKTSQVNLPVTLDMAQKRNQLVPAAESRGVSFDLGWSSWFLPGAGRTACGPEGIREFPAGKYWIYPLPKKRSDAHTLFWLRSARGSFAAGTLARGRT